MVMSSPTPDARRPATPPQPRTATAAQVETLIKSSLAPVVRRVAARLLRRNIAPGMPAIQIQLAAHLQCIFAAAALASRRRTCLNAANRREKFVVETSTSPCQSCGACCAYSRDWPRFTTEDDAALDLIPARFVNAGQSGMRCKGERCAALTGRVGEATACAIYALRPEVCRACHPGDPECTIARRAFGLPELAALFATAAG